MSILLFRRLWLFLRNTAKIFCDYIYLLIAANPLELGVLKKSFRNMGYNTPLNKDVLISFNFVDNTPVKGIICTLNSGK